MSYPGEYKKIKSDKFAEGVSDKDLESVQARGKNKRSVYVLEHSPHIDPR